MPEEELKQAAETKLRSGSPEDAAENAPTHLSIESDLNCLSKIDKVDNLTGSPEKNAALESKTERTDDPTRTIDPLPRVVLGTIVATSLSFLVQWVLYNCVIYSSFVDQIYSGGDFERTLRFILLKVAPLLVALPVQSYWAHCYAKISKITSQLYSCPKPIETPVVWFISLLGIVCLSAGSWMHPAIFVVGVALALSLPVFLLLKVLQPKHGHGNLRYSIGLIVYLLCAFWLIMSGGRSIGMVQFILIWYLLLALKSSLKPVELAKYSLEDKPKQDILLNYKAFAAIDRWRKEQQRAVKQDARTILTISIVMCLLYLFGFNALSGDQSQNGANSPTSQSMLSPTSTQSSNSSNQSTAIIKPAPAPAFDSENAEKSSQFVKVLNGFFVVMAVFAIVFVQSKPTHIGLSPSGFRFVWRRLFVKVVGDCIEWTNVKNVRIEKPGGKTNTNDELLCFELYSGQTQKIKMGSIDSVEDRETLLKAIQKWAPQASRDANVIESLQAPANHSYTELWLQALSAPPKRERLKPLAANIVLKNRTYRVICQLGAGGQGQAYLAEDIKTGGEIVLKEFILPVFVDIKVRRSALEQFENEARILRQLEHPQIVKLVDFFLEDHRSYLVLEHINGASLREIVKKNGRMSESQVKQLAVQMCGILGYLHSLSSPVVHRDFTPDNLILRNDGTLKLIDFNVAKQVVESTTSGTVVGKHAYLPPEQFRGMPEPASDIYAMGATLHFLLTAQDPEPISMSQPKRVVPDLSDGLNEIVRKATALDLQKRYNSSGELLKDLEKLA